MANFVQHIGMVSSYYAEIITSNGIDGQTVIRLQENGALEEAFKDLNSPKRWEVLVGKHFEISLCNLVLCTKIIWIKS